jgi:hypothetical protein
MATALISFRLIAGILTGFSHAALIANWGAAGVVTVTDLANDNSSGGLATDILSLKFVTEGTTNYFLMTIAAVPSTSTFSEAYMLNFDYAAGGANASGIYYIASGLTGIDELIDAPLFRYGCDCLNDVAATMRIRTFSRQTRGEIFNSPLIGFHTHHRSGACSAAIGSYLP